MSAGIFMIGGTGVKASAGGASDSSSMARVAIARERLRDTLPAKAAGVRIERFRVTHITPADHTAESVTSNSGKTAPSESGGTVLVYGARAGSACGVGPGCGSGSSTRTDQ